MALQAGSRLGPYEVGGDVEVDETFIGGKARNMHIAQRRRRITGTGTKDKTAVLGILERGGKVRTTVVDNRRKKTLQARLRSTSKPGRRSTPTHSCPTTGWRSGTPIR